MIERLTTNPELRQVVRFVFWGGINTVFSFAVYCIFIYLGAGIYISSLVGLIAGILFGHYANKRNVFESSKTKTLRRYALIWVGLYLINIGILKHLTSIGFDPYISGAVAGVLLVPASFVLQKFLVF